jgi:hypothetical protein
LRWGLWAVILLILVSQIAWDDDRHMSLCPATSWDGVLQTFCLG